MFDILDNPTTFSYIQNTNSRSSSAKKIQKSQYLNGSSIDSKKNNHKNSLFEGILDSPYEKQKKNVGNISKNMSVSVMPRNNLDSLNINFGDFAKSKEINNISNSRLVSKISINRNSLEEHQEDQILNQNFGQTQNTILNPSKIQESFVSTRNMRPPKNKRQSINQPLNHTVAFGLDEVILQEQATITNSSHRINQYKTKNDNKSKRRSSIDSRSDIYDAESITNIFETNNPNHIRFDSIKQDKHKHPNDSNYQTEKQIIAHQSKYSHKNQIQERSQNKQLLEIIQKLKINNKETIQKYENDINNLKERNQQQIKFLQQSLQAKVKQNAQLRDYFIKQTNKVIEQERCRTKKVYEEEISRHKEMIQWQKERLKSTYLLEIQTLKKTISFNNHFSSLQHNQTNSVNKHHWQTQEQLKFKALNLNQRQKQLQKRQNQIQFKWQELISTKRYDQQRLRQEQKKIYESQTAQKKYLMEQKRQLAEQKRLMSIQMGNLELQYFKRKQDLDIRAKEVRLEAQILENQRQQMQLMNQEMMKKHKLQAEHHMSEREKLKQIEIQLLKKIQVVQLRARANLYNGQNQFQKLSSQLKPKENFNQPQTLSMKKQLQKSKNTQSMLQINKTKQKFAEVKQSLNGRAHLTLKENKKMDLSKYMQKVNQNNRKQYF